MTSLPRRAVLAIALVFALGTAALSAQASYSSSPLPSPPGGGSIGGIHLNNLGHACGNAGGVGYYWGGGGTLTSLPGVAQGINDSDVVIGHGGSFGTSEVRPAWMWKAGTATDISSSVGSDNYPYGINKYGWIVGTSDTVPFLYQPALGARGAVARRIPNPGQSVRPVAINAQGQTAMQTSEQVTVYDLDLYKFMNGTVNYTGLVDDMNDLGQVSGSSGGHATIWDNGKAIDLGVSGDGVMINNAGQVVFRGPVDAACTCTHVYLWQNGSLTDLAALTGHLYTSVYDINDAGQIVVNERTYPGGWAVDTAVLLTPSSPPAAQSPIVTPSPVAATLPDGGTAGLIAFSSMRDGDYDLYVTTADGSSTVRLPNSPAFDAEPAWSPDRTKIAFRSNRGSDRIDHIFLMNANGTNVVQLTPGNGQRDASPVWSPDGSKIAFVSRRDNTGDWEAYVMNADGSSPTRLTNSPGDDLWPGWSPNGQTIAFASDREGTSKIFTMSASGGVATRVTNLAEDFQPRYSADGLRIAFTRAAIGSSGPGSGSVWTMASNGGGPAVLNAGMSNNSPSWAVNGTELVSIWSGHLVRMADTTGGSYSMLTSASYMYDYDPSWQPALRGDANGDNSVTPSDVFDLISYLFGGGARPAGSADVNGDGAVDIGDVFYLLNYLFAGGTAPH